jgi:diguanylate cyclase (GGDEF)-like protein/PAS domain S-box-containing protein
MVKRNYILLSSITLILMISYHFFLIESFNRIAAYNLIISSIYIIIAVIFLVIAYRTKIKTLAFCALTVFVTAIIESYLFGHASITFQLMFIFDLIYLSGLAIGLSVFLKYTLNQKKLNDQLTDINNQLEIFSKISENFYFKFNMNNSDTVVEITQGFVEKYQLKYDRLTTTLDEYCTFIHPDDRSKIDEVVEKLKENKEITCEYRLKFPGMTEYSWLYARAFIQDGHAVGIDLDITSLKKLKQSFEKSQSELSSNKTILELKQKEQDYILDNTSDYIAKFSPTGEIIYATPTFVNFFNLPMEHIIGHNIKDVNKKADIITDHAFLDHVMKPPYQYCVVNQSNVKGNLRWISWKNHGILDANGAVDYILSIGHDVTEIKNLNNQLKKESNHDYLTGLINRRGLSIELEKVKTNKKTTVAFFIDINHFKSINDYYGHDVGDEIIMTFANQLKPFESSNCKVCRYSGDEFVMICHIESHDQIEQIKEELTKSVEVIYYYQTIKIQLDASVGYALYPEDTDDIHHLITFSDLAMFEAKRSNFHRCIRYASYMSQQLDQKVILAKELKEAIQEDLLDVFFQPIMNVEQDSIDFLEALVRWENGLKGWMSPAMFLPIAEDTGLMIRLDLLLIEKSIHKFSLLKEESPYKNTILNINVSPQTLLKANIHEFILQTSNKYKIHPNQICIEISENTFVNNVEETNKVIRKLKQLGFIIALDDFGREYSSLAILENMEFDIIKIDRYFIDRLHLAINLNIVQMIMKISQISNKLVVAEGVETLHQKEQLMSLSCHLQQGYFFAKPEKLI